VKRFFAWLLGGLALFGFLRRRQQSEAPDARADELRQKLAESRAIVSEREEFEAAETPIDQAEPLGDPDARRRAVHEAARVTAERMRERD
jgi:hypothetical protein